MPQKLYLDSLTSGNQASRKFAFCNRTSSIPLDCFLGINNSQQISENLDRIIDLTNLDSFISDGGKFLYTSTSYQTYSSNVGNTISGVPGHLTNSIHFPYNILRMPKKVYVNKPNIDNIIFPVQNVSTEMLNEILNNASLSKNDKICVYCDSATPNDACHVFYMLYKLDFNVYYLNVNYTTLDNEYKSSSYPIWNTVKEKNTLINNYNVTPEQLINYMTNSNTKLIDVRPPSQYNGITSNFPVFGHIKGAISIPWQNMFITGTCVFKTQTDLADLFTDSEINSNNKIIVSCNTGSELTSVFFALKFILKWPNIQAFEVSFNVYQQLNQVYPDIYQVES